MQYQKCALVTGGSHGIGQGIAVALARDGYDVAITYRTRPEGAQETQELVEKEGRRCIAIQADLAEPDASQTVVDAAVAGLGHLDLLVCNAGRTEFRSILNITREQIDALYSLDYRSYLLTCGAAARHMVLNGIRGNIIFITSSRGSRAYPEDMLYGGIKAALERSCESIALDLSPYGIRVNCVAPGATEKVDMEHPVPTSMDPIIPLGRKATPLEIGQAIVYLCSEAGSYITGVTLRLDGGLILAGAPESMVDRANWINPDWVRQQREALDQAQKGDVKA